MIIQTISYPRAGLVGNPSDGYFGKTIAFTFADFCAKIVLYESPEIEILPSRRDHSVFRSVQSIVEDVRLHGYYGGFRLLKATIKRFADYCNENGVILDNRNFTLRYESNIPGRVGLAGSSAIITACLRALMKFYAVQIPYHRLAALALSVENDELQIPAGLQDRVAQAYQDLVYMNFDKSLIDARGYGQYEVLDKQKLPPLYIAYRESLSEGTEVLHSDLRVRWKNGDPEIFEAMQTWAGYAETLKGLLEELPSEDRDHEIARILNANFDLRRKICPVSAGNIEMVEAARSFGASAKFAGSGGAIVGTYHGDDMFQQLREKLAPLGVRVFKPTLCEHIPAVDKPLAENPKEVY